MKIIGFDAAAQSENSAFCFSQSANGSLVVDRKPQSFSTFEEAAEECITFLQDSGEALIAIDAPLGWPRALGDLLTRHRAGEPIQEAAESLFFRRCDRRVREDLQIIPLSVAADRIARVARSALRFLDLLRMGLKRPALPLVWDPDFKSEVGVMEVYPKATLKRLYKMDSAYRGKKPDHVKQRQEIWKRMGQDGELSLNSDIDVNRRADDLDSILCALTAHCFLSHGCVDPEADEVADARREGWIWFPRVRTPA